MPQIADFGQANSPYRSPGAWTAQRTADASPEALEDELRAFVGPRADYYLRKWAPRLQDPSGEVGMNWVAFFLTACWFGYRKMYRATFIYFAVVALLAIFEEVLFVGIFKLPDIPTGIDLIVNLMIAITCGVCGNSWYLSHAIRAISTARAQGLEDDHLLHVLSKRGGTSLTASFGLAFLCFVAIVAAGVFWALLLRST